MSYKKKFLYQTFVDLSSDFSSILTQKKYLYNTSNYNFFTSISSHTSIHLEFFVDIRIETRNPLPYLLFQTQHESAEHFFRLHLPFIDRLDELWHSEGTCLSKLPPCSGKLPFETVSQLLWISDGFCNGCATSGSVCVCNSKRAKALNWKVTGFRSIGNFSCCVMCFFLFFWSVRKLALLVILVCMFRFSFCDSFVIVVCVRSFARRFCEIAMLIVKMRFIRCAVVFRSRFVRSDNFE